MSLGFASRYTHVAASQTDSQIQSGNPIHIWGIQASAGTAGTVTIEEAGTSTVIMIIDLATNGTFVLDVPFLADAGLQVTTAADTTCTVFHDSAGA
jgi:hypothetical protein